MHVVRHECIGMQLSACLRQRLSEPMQIRTTVLIAKETRFGYGHLVRCSTGHHPSERVFGEA